MGVASPARTVALHLLGRQRRRDGRARDLLRGAHEMASLGTKGRALATRLVLGVNVAAGELDRRIDAFVTHASGLEPRVRDALRIAAFEALYLDTPRQVSVSQGVELVRGVAPRAARMANAVLRRIAECRGEVDVARATVARAAEGGTEASPVDLRLASGYPDWLVRRLVAEVGAQGAACMCACALEPAPVYVAAGKEAAAETLFDTLSESGLAPEPSGLPLSWRLGTSGGLAMSGLVNSCQVVVADLAAQMVCRVAASGSGRVLEVGQGRGTKSILLASAGRELARQGEVVEIVGCDLVGSKVRIATDRMRDAGLGGAVSCVAFDALRLASEDELPGELSGTFDSVLVDAPCSGTGTMRRHPETPWNLTGELVDPAVEGSLPQLQLAMLRAASARVAPGGTLAYATCSVLAAENEDVVSAFLGSGEGECFERVAVSCASGVLSLSAEGRELVAASVGESGAFQSVPRPGSYDGHFCALLRRVR